MKKSLSDEFLKNVSGGCAQNEDYERYIDMAIYSIQNCIPDSQYKLEEANEIRNSFDSMCNYSKDSVVEFLMNLKAAFPEAAIELDQLLADIANN